MSTYEDHITRQYGDTTECSRCGKQWDTNDPEPPPCISKEEQRQITRSKAAKYCSDKCRKAAYDRRRTDR